MNESMGSPSACAGIDALTMANKPATIQIYGRATARTDALNLFMDRATTPRLRHPARPESFTAVCPEYEVVDLPNGLEAIDAEPSSISSERPFFIVS